MALVVYSIFLHFIFLGDHTLRSHEALLAVRTRETFRLGDGMYPHLNGEPDLQKPPLPFWQAGAIAAVRGRLDEWAVRAPSAAASVLTMLLLVALARNIAGSTASSPTNGWRVALLTGFAYTTSWSALVWGRRAEVDSQLVFWTTAMLTCYWLGLREENRRRQVLYFAGMWAATGLGIVAKGPFAVPFLGMVVVAMFLVSPRGRRIGRMLPLAGPVIALALCVPWYAMAAVWAHHRGGDALDLWLMHSVGRFSGQMDSPQPFWFYPAQAWFLWLPWPVAMAFGVATLVRRRDIGREAKVYLAAWAAGGLLFLSVSTTKYVHYALVIGPPMFILAGLGLDHLIFTIPRRLSRLGRAAVASHGVLPAAGVPVALALQPAFGPAGWWIVAVAAFVAAAMAVILALFWVGRRLSAAFVLAGTVAVAYPVAMTTAVQPIFNATNEPALAGKHIARHVPPRVGASLYRKEPIDAATIFYAGRPLEFITSPEHLHNWLGRHPRGRVLVKRNLWLKEVLRHGRWRCVPYNTGRYARYQRYLLLRPLAVPTTRPAPAPPADGRRKRLPGTTLPLAEACVSRGD
jgi:4-amino-4-deoxy-L-arabinose transferase-like glycosyltransferase